mgnify:FL=1|jgi:hypothetical protein|tara:strand:+ start:3982 stop:4695 length:714 start_codon:yes stop_codon:yes gene_type:complete
MIQKRTYIILFAILASIILYLTGVFSGLYANKIFTEETKKDIFKLKRETKLDLNLLENYIDLLDSNLKSMQLEQIFIETLTGEKMCAFSTISLNQLFSQLGYYWERLPFRLEEYERYNEPSEEYNLLKEQYAHISIRTWIIARNQYEECSKDLIHGLYFYSADCEECIEQGEQLDELNRKAKEKGKDVVIFPIDFHMNESIVTNLKKYYGINTTPAITINDNVFQGRLFTSEELLPK